MTYNPPAIGAEGYIGVKRVWNPGDAGDPFSLFTAPTSWLLAEANGLDSVPAHVAHNVYGGGRDADRGHRTGKYKCGGPVGLALYPNNGHDLMVGALGKEVSLASQAVDTTTAVANDSSGTQTTLTLTTGGTYNFGDIVVLDAGLPNSEPLPVISYNTTAKTLVVPVPKNTHSGAGTTVQQFARSYDRPLTNTDGPRYERILPFLCAETSTGGIYNYRYTGGQVGKFDIKATAAKIELGTELWFNAQRTIANGSGVALAVPTTPSPTNATTGGTIAAGVVGVKVAYVNAVGIGVASTAGTTTTTTGTSTVTVPSPSASTGATGYMVYASLPGGTSYYLQTTTPVPIGTNTTLTSISQTATLAPTTDTSAGTVPTAYDPTDVTLNDLSYEFTDGFLCVPYDNAMQGYMVTGFQQLGGDWQVTLNNNLREDNRFNRSDVVLHRPGQRVVDVVLNLENTSNRPAFWTDLLHANLNFPFIAFMALPNPTAASGWNAMSIVVPNCRAITDPTKAPLDGLVEEEVHALALAVGTSPKLACYVM